MQPLFGNSGLPFSLLFFASGASDDAVSCAVMLEVLHSLANQSTPLHHGVVFLFNGAEENILQVTDDRRSAAAAAVRILRVNSRFNHSSLVSWSSFRPATASSLSMLGPSRCEPSLTWKLPASVARKWFSKQVQRLHLSMQIMHASEQRLPNGVFCISLS